MTGTYRVAWTDGSSLGNPGPGGYAAIVADPEGESEGVPVTIHTGNRLDTTNNRMELAAAYMALRACPEGANVTIVTDSKYVADGMTKWIVGWEAQNWRTASKKPVKNREIWQGLRKEEARMRSVNWIWIEGHAGHTQNELADRIAVRSANERRQGEMDESYDASDDDARAAMEAAKAFMAKGKK